MTGWPLLRAFLTLLALVLAGLPLRSLTGPKTSVAQPAAVAETTETVGIALVFTQPPEQFALKFLGKDILTGGNGASFESETTFEARIPKEGIDLVFEGRWPEYFRKVGVSVRLTRANGVQETKTIWGKRDLFELLTFGGDH